MEPRVLAALVASLVSQSLLLLLSLPFSTTPTLPLSRPFLPLLLHLLSSSQIAASTSLLSRKRKRTQKDPILEEEEEEETSTAPSNSLVPRTSPDHFRLCFGMTSSTFNWLSGLLDPLLDCRDPVGFSLRIPGPTRLAIALSRLASGAPYPDLARRFAVSETAARFCAKHLCRVLCTNFRFWLAFPSPPDSSAFCSLSGGLPDCCGAIACTRFGARSGPVAAQIVADASSRILSIAAGFRGERLDSAVLRCSSLYRDVEAGRLLGRAQYLVGDGGGYPLLPWLMVPFASPALGSSEEDFNAVHQLMCRPVRRAVCSLRNWGVLSRLVEEEDGKVAVACIATCAILHNVLLMREDYSALSSEVTKEELSLEKYGEGEAWGIEEDSSAREKAFVARSTLAVRARAIRGAGHLVCSL